MHKRKLPIGGIQTFSILREEYDVYVDKTQLMYDITSRYRAVFLSRPRRFGKSLLCSTFESLYKGEKQYFDGLAISKTDWQWKEHPVIHLALGGGDFTDNGVEVLVSQLKVQLVNHAEKYGIEINAAEDPSVIFTQLILKLSQKINRVVVIIDEYDNPLLSTINQKDLNVQLREKLKGFYSVIKQYDSCLKFVFITGVTKFAQVSVFSGMNQVSDISMMPEYCAICGLTQMELEAYFVPEIDMYAEKHGGRENYLEKLKEYYNGYCFTREKTSVYNPYGILFHFDNSADFMPYWSFTGAPSFLLKYLEMKNAHFIEIEDAQMEANKFFNLKDDTITLFPLLYQAGYLTISDYNETTGFYTLNYPNVEIRKTFAEFLADNYSEAQSISSNSISLEFINALRSGDTEDFMNILKWYLANVDYSLCSRITEYYVEFAVSNIINMLGFVCKNEVHTATGRMDSVIFTKERIYILEFKVDKPVETALRQIKHKDYALFYEKDGREIIKVGIVFSREERNIISWKTEKDKVF